MYNMYVIRDKVADEIAPLFQAKNDAVAMRMFNQSINAVHNTDDYELICVGMWDDKELKFVNVGSYVVGGIDHE